MVNLISYVDPNVAYNLAYYISKGAIKVVTRK